MCPTSRTARDRRQDIPADHFPEHHSAVPEVIPPLKDTAALRTLILRAPFWAQSNLSRDNSSRVNRDTHTSRPHWFKSASKTPMIHRVSYAVRSSHILNIATAPPPVLTVTVGSVDHSQQSTHNLSGYDEISTCKSCCYGDSWYPHLDYNVLGIYTLEPPSSKWRNEEIVNRVQLYRVHCNLLKIVDSPSPPCGFSQIGFPRKNSIYLLALCLRISSWPLFSVVRNRPLDQSCRKISTTYNYRKTWELRNLSQHLKFDYAMKNMKV